MRVSSRQKKWIKIVTVPIAIILLLVLVVSYTVSFRLKQTIQLIVDKESNAIYRFDAGKIDVSLRERRVFIKNASFVCKDTTNTTPHYDVQIPEMYFAIGSWRELVIKQRLVIDSLSIALPVVQIHEHTQQKAKRIAFHASNIFDVLQKTSDRLLIRSFSLQKASFNYGNIHLPKPFKSSRISLLIKNFSRDNEPGRNFLSSDDVDLSITQQNWKLPDGLHEISFSQLHFSGGNQFFEIDSCIFKGTDKNNREYSISADKLFFNSQQLADFYNKEELVIDTLILHRPVISLERPSSGNKSNDSSSTHISESFKDIFKLMQFRYVDVRDGSIEIRYEDDDQPSFISGKTNLKIYNLLLSENSTNINVDSISLQQRNLTLITKDSLFKLSVEEFGLQNNIVFLKNASYTPTEINHNSKIFTFKTALIKLSNIDLEDLAEKRLTATDAEVHQPELIFKTVSQKKTATQKQQFRDKFYTTLHGLSELINVEKFRIIKGRLNFQSSGAAPLRLHAENINMLVLLDRLFSSDSLIDVKRSLPMVAVEKLQLESQKVQLQVSDFSFEGNVRHNRAGTFNLALANGTELKGRDLSWIIFDWDKYRTYKKIDVNTLHLGELLVNTPATTSPPKEHAAKDLPVIHVDRIDVDKLEFNQPGSNSQVHFTAQQLCIDDINSLQHALTWNNAEGRINNMVITKPGLNAHANIIDFNTQAESSIQNVSLNIHNQGSRTDINIPRIQTNIQVHSTNLAETRIASLAIQHPHATIVRTTATTASRAGTVKTAASPISVDQLNIIDGTFSYRANTADSLVIQSGLNINARNLTYNNINSQLLSWQALGLHLHTLQFQKQSTQATAAALNIQLSTGELQKEAAKTILQGPLSASWQDVAFTMKKPDSSVLSIENILGNIKDERFKWISNDKPNFNIWLDKLQLHGGSLSYKNKKSIIDAGGIHYNGGPRSLQLNTFSFQPAADAATLFKNTGWQTSHTSLRTGSIQLNNIHWEQTARNRLLKADELRVNNMELITIKDKRYPFKHGIERPMLAQTINNIPLPIDIKRVVLNNGSVYVHEITEKIHKEAIVPLKQINAVATHVRNRNNQTDSLHVEATLQLYSTQARYFRYSEAYGDSLAAFSLQVQLSPIQLPEFTALTIPFANVSVTNGKADTLFASWYGNKYAAAGKMDFYYDNLKIKMLSKRDSTRSGFAGSIGNFLANSIALHKKNNEQVFIFYVRDREKSVFNYWVKTKLNGVLGSAAILQRKKHYRLYKKNKEKYYLPDMNE